MNERITLVEKELNGLLFDYASNESSVDFSSDWLSNFTAIRFDDSPIEASKTINEEVKEIKSLKPPSKTRNRPSSVTEKSQKILSAEPDEAFDLILEVCLPFPTLVACNL